MKGSPTSFDFQIRVLSLGEGLTEGLGFPIGGFKNVLGYVETRLGF